MCNNISFGVRFGAPDNEKLLSQLVPLHDQSADRLQNLFGFRVELEETSGKGKTKLLSFNG